MQFRTQIPVSKSNVPIDYNSGIVSLGSCFAENIGEKFRYFKFPVFVNPFGTIFNPVSLEKLLLRSIRKDYFTNKDVFFYNELWHSYEVHSELSFSDKRLFLNQLNMLLDELYNRLLQGTHVCITLGTSWVYRNTESGKIVANCHKVPQKQFTKELLSVAMIKQSLERIISEIEVLNPELKFIFTVSPVRHSKDGFVENQLSKSHLIAALHESLRPYQSNTYYFPSYEIMMDELRDYRFYAADMLHPNSVAIDYIWERFFQNCVSENEFPLMRQVCDIQKALAHKPFNPNTESHQNFLKNLQHKIALLQNRIPHISFE